MFMENQCFNMLFSFFINTIVIFSRIFFILHLSQNTYKFHRSIIKIVVNGLGDVKSHFRLLVCIIERLKNPTEINFEFYYYLLVSIENVTITCCSVLYKCVMDEYLTGFNEINMFCNTLTNIDL